MKFTEETLEQAVIELFEAEQIPHCNGMFVHKEISDVLLHEDLKQFLLNKYADDDVTFPVWEGFNLHISRASKDIGI